MERFKYLAVPFSDEVKDLADRKDTHVWWWQWRGREWHRIDQPAIMDGSTTIALVAIPAENMPHLEGAVPITDVKDPIPLPPPMVQFTGDGSLTEFADRVRAALQDVTVPARRTFDPT